MRHQTQLLVLVALFLSAFTINAQTFKLTGKVTNESNQALAGASVILSNSQSGTTASFDGNYSLHLNKGAHQLTVSYMGYTTKEVTINMSKNTVLNFVLKANRESLEEVLVSAIRVKGNAPVTYSNINKEELEKRNLGQDIPTLLNFLPSVVTTSDAGAGVGYSGIRVRGSDATRVNITINGIPYNDAESQGTYWVNMPDFASSTESMQLQRGVGTSTNGSGAFGASLNVLTNAVSNEAYGEISSSIGSYNTQKHSVKFSTGLLNDRIEIAGRLSKIDSDGYIDRAWSDLKSYFLQATYIDDNTLIKALTFGGHEKTYQAWYGITAQQLKEDRKQNPYTYENEIDNYQQDHYQFHWNQRYSDAWSTNLGLNYTKGKGYFEQFKDGEDFADYDFTPITIGGETIDTTDLVRRRWLDNDFYVLNFNTNYKNDALDLIIGGSHSNYQGDHFGEVIWAQNAGGSNLRDRYYESDAKKIDNSVFAKATYKLNEQLSIYGDLQGRFVNYKTKGMTSDRNPINVDADFSFFNPKAGITYDLSGANSFYFSVARANKEPNRNDFENGINQSEQLTDFELGHRFNIANVQINTNGYYMSYKNQLVLTGAIDDTGSPIRATSGKSYRLGLEIDASIKLSNTVTWRPNLALSSNKNTDFHTLLDGELTNLGTTDLSFSPDVIVGNVITYAPTNNLQFSLLSKYVGDQFMGNTSTEQSKLDNYFVDDLTASYEFTPKSIFKSIRFTAMVNNIFNVKYVSNGYYYTYDDTWSEADKTTTIHGAGYYPQATTNFLLGATLRF
ncbi:MAG: TonB-dependent receptor [Flavobacteriaceae bacterium]|nr:MAG: TonB-dependent receptor [Flavobacteriaceae bacterium]